MAFTFRDRAKESSTTTGTGAYTPGGAVTGYQSLACVGDLKQNFFMAVDVDGSGLPLGGWECFIGTYYLNAGSTPFLTRDTILASSNAGAAVNWGAGTRHIAVTQPAMMAGRFVQQQYSQSGAMITSASTIVITAMPTISQGVQAFSVPITPKNANHLLRIEVTIQLAVSSQTWMIAALFQDAITNGLAGGFAYNSAATGACIIKFTYWMVAGTASATTFTVRIGGHPVSTVTMNGQNGIRWFGGTLYSSLIIREYAINP